MVASNLKFDPRRTFGMWLHTNERVTKKKNQKKQKKKRLPKQSIKCEYIYQ